MTNPLEEIAQVVRARDRLLIVDAISSLSSIPLETDAWGLDVVVSGSQKGWMTAPGLSFVSVSDRAWEAQDRCTTPRMYLDLRRAQRSQEAGQTPWTPAISLMFQLRQALRMLRAEGMDRYAALLEAGKHRFRPILMTSFTTICGLIPMAVGNSRMVGMPYAPLGRTMMGGLLASMVLTLVIVPLCYTFFDDLRTLLQRVLASAFKEGPAGAQGAQSATAEYGK